VLRCRLEVVQLVLLFDDMRHDRWMFPPEPAKRG
jgi:hypothetical protein